MANQAQTPVKRTPTGGMSNNAQEASKDLVGIIDGNASWIAQRGRGVMDRVCSPDQRAAFLDALQTFMSKNPKLSAFLGINLVLTGIPLGLFILFIISVALFALVVGLLLGLLGAVVFTLFCVGTALVIVLPTIFFTTMAATFLFLWGLGGYYILRWANSEPKDNLTLEGATISDKLNSLTGGHVSGFTGTARNETAKAEITGYRD